MASIYSYSGDPAASIVDKLRSLCEDTLQASDSWFFSNEELAAQAEISGGVFSAASDLCGKLALRHAAQVDTALSGVVSKAKSQRARVYLEMQQRYRETAIRLGEKPATPAAGASDAGGLFVAGVEGTRPAFRSSVSDCSLPGPYGREWPYPG